MRKVSRVPLSRIRRAGRRYARDRIDAANLGDELTLDDADRLPPDLREQLMLALRAAEDERVSADRLIDIFAQYVARSAATVDLDGDDHVTKSDAKRLPPLLRQNFLTYLDAIAPRPAGTSMTERGRTALTNYVKDVLLNSAEPEGGAFRTTVLGGRTANEKRQVGETMLAEAALWAPDAPGWERSTEGAVIVFSGRLYQLYTELKFDGSKAPRVYVKID